MVSRTVMLWLGWLDSDQRMTESKSVALPLGYTPKYSIDYIKNAKHFCFALVAGVDNRIRTDDLQGHNLAL